MTKLCVTTFICVLTLIACTKSKPESLGKEACALYIEKALEFYTGKQDSKDQMISNCGERMIPYAAQDFASYKVSFKEFESCIETADNFNSFAKCKGLMIGGIPDTLF